MDQKGSAVHLLDSICKSHRLTIRSSYGAEMLAAAHGYDDAYPTLVTVAELKHGALRPEELKRFREEGGLASGLRGNAHPSKRGEWYSQSTRRVCTNH